MLKANVKWPESRRFKSHSEWEPVGFFSEGLCNATTFDLKLGFFSSSAINVLCDGFACFLYHGGRMRLIINDVLSERDKESINEGMSDSILPTFDIRNLETLKNTLSERDRHFFECLAWLIRNERIEIKIIAPREGNGIAHTKCGMFGDGINKVAFDGSCNFSRTALIENCESITAFCDWDGGKDIFKVNDIEDDFNRTFLEKDTTVQYVAPQDIRTHLTNSFKEKDIIKLLEEEDEIINDHLEFATSRTVHWYLARARARVAESIDQIKKSESKIDITKDEPHFPYPSGPREYQKQAFENWKKAQRGLFAMATGTGKTLTSLNCLLEIYKRCKYYKAVILVPTLTLVDQWVDECKKFNFSNIYIVCSRNTKWRGEIEMLQMKEEFNSSDVPLSYIIISISIVLPIFRQG